MIGARAKSKWNGRRVQRAASEGTFRGLAHAGAAIRLAARRSIRRSAKPSMEGAPPHTRRGLMKRAILYSVDKRRERVVIGPAHSIAGPSGGVHEFGGRFRKRMYPRRPFMGPALIKLRNRLPKMWASSIR